jgi:hypothetical protein
MSDHDEAVVSLAIGRLEGRLGALELRLSRHEDWVGQTLNALSSKIDNIDTKLDAKMAEIITNQARGDTLISAAKWLIGVLLATYGWFSFWRGHH